MRSGAHVHPATVATLFVPSPPCVRPAGRDSAADHTARGARRTTGDAAASRPSTGPRRRTSVYRRCASTSRRSLSGTRRAAAVSTATCARGSGRRVGSRVSRRHPAPHATDRPPAARRSLGDMSAAKPCRPHWRPSRAGLPRGRAERLPPHRRHRPALRRPEREAYGVVPSLTPHSRRGSPGHTSLPRLPRLSRWAREHRPTPGPVRRARDASPRRSRARDGATPDGRRTPTEGGAAPGGSSSAARSRAVTGTARPRAPARTRHPLRQARTALRWPRRSSETAATTLPVRTLARPPTLCSALRVTEGRTHRSRDAEDGRPRSPPRGEGGARTVLEAQFSSMIVRERGERRSSHVPHGHQASAHCCVPRETWRASARPRSERSGT